ncbi:MAG TPA: hypothetical protein DDZ83_18555 [Nitrospinae bacterium]|nr:hypothetical protein [Nitrospinota bacterium]
MGHGLEAIVNGGRAGGGLETQNKKKLERASDPAVFDGHVPIVRPLLELRLPDQPLENHRAAPCPARQNPSEVNVSVTTVFPPEEFHISIYQNLGSMRGVREKTAALYSMTPANIRNLSRYYWIHQIDLIPGK